MPELAAKLHAEHGVVVHPASLSKFLIKQGFSFKKNTAGDRSRSR
jgi:transposase